MQNDGRFQPGRLDALRKDAPEGVEFTVLTDGRIRAYVRDGPTRAELTLVARHDPDELRQWLAGWAKGRDSERRILRIAEARAEAAEQRAARRRGPVGGVQGLLDKVETARAGLMWAELVDKRRRSTPPLGEEYHVWRAREQAVEKLDELAVAMGGSKMHVAVSSAGDPVARQPVSEHPPDRRRREANDGRGETAAVPEQRAADLEAVQQGAPKGVGVKASGGGIKAYLLDDGVTLVSRRDPGELRQWLAGWAKGREFRIIGARAEAANRVLWKVRMLRDALRWAVHHEVRRLTPPLTGEARERAERHAQKALDRVSELMDELATDASKAHKQRVAHRVAAAEADAAEAAVDRFLRGMDRTPLPRAADLEAAEHRAEVAEDRADSWRCWAELVRTHEPIPEVGAALAWAEQMDRHAENAPPTSQRAASAARAARAAREWARLEAKDGC